ncbi:CrcB family protein [Glutamicibacter sp. JL.03c]|uniref:fluoride efflux transporter FluC n=1 Tax=Glutamicibacter sp. JL.03c TaxID=2984842 RepID=UPI0021F79D8F|nr:CrcB family protein [Glutamicibacter sp. JL.03c]UYQ78652.1 CrcB family protein [Glutamicibacter sp. JL.03c]
MPAPRFALRPIEVLLVFVGGGAGTASRLAVSLALPQHGSVPVAILLINVSGAFALGWLLTSLSARGPETPRRKSLRLLLGTGFFGGFTTYSALATDTMLLFGQGSLTAALAYGLGTVLLGALATWCGMLAGSKREPSSGGAS